MIKCKYLGKHWKNFREIFNKYEELSKYLGKYWKNFREIFKKYEELSANIQGNVGKSSGKYLRNMKN